MREQLYRMSAVLLMAGIMSSTIIVFAKSNTEAEEREFVEVRVEEDTVECVTVEEIGLTEYNSPIEKAFEELEVFTYPEFEYNRDWDEEETYLLAKIAMAEAEGENIQTKTLVILAVLNRVHSGEFPDTIHDVIFQYDEEKEVHQFSPVMPNGRWWRVEPNEECYEAVEIVRTAQYDYSGGALFFESCDYDSWHSKNLEFLYQSENMRFYK